jgi:hypothetical protein
MIRKMPGTPIAASRTGATISATTNDSPMLMPMNAMARVRTSVRVRSATSAVTEADTAPDPWTTRASVSSARLWAIEPITDPTANSPKPKVISGLRP